MEPICIPAIRGVLGSIVYYASSFTFGQIEERVQRVTDELHSSVPLREQLQRALTSNYKNISDYIISQKDHFFNALILAVYDGEPVWNEIEVDFHGKDYNSMGFLMLNGQEKIFPVDGQHRVEGIKDALKQSPDLKNESITVILIGHINSPSGREKSRRIFSTLNRYAKPVSMGDLIALDEDDIVAIATRELLESYPLFMNDNVKAGAKRVKSLPENDVSSFTSLITLYETNLIIYVNVKK